jgi:crotonobetainyl-CoA:carnitine CoA-transferase CaiB-like acyl-CoA transferase
MLVGIPAGGRTVRVPGNPIKLSDVGPLPSATPPALGEHTEAVRAVVDHAGRPDA